LSDPHPLFNAVDIRDVFRLSFVANSITVPVYDEVGREFALKRGEYLLLFCLSHLPDLRAQDVANITGRPRNSVSRAVNRMIEHGYIERTQDPEDGRQGVLNVTRRGRRVNEKIQPLFKARGDEVFGVLNAREHEQLDLILAYLTAGLFARLE